MASKLVRDDKYYMGYAIFLVEDTYFKVPTMTFEEESEVFKTMFTLPPSPEEEVDGKSDDKPIRLDGVKKDEFKCLLQLFYPGQCLAPQLTPKEWIHVLTLSTKWGMARVRTEAIAQIHKSQRGFPHTLLKLGREYDVEEWIFIGVDRLARRAQPLSAEDVKLIGLDEVLKIAAIRECCCLHYGGDCKDKRGQLRQIEKLDERIKAEYKLSTIPTMEFRQVHVT